MGFDISTEASQPDTVIIRFSGQFDFTHVATARAAIAETIEAGAHLIVINLDGLDYIDSAGLGVLVGTLARLRDRNGELAVVCRSPRIRRVFEITRLTQLISLMDSEAEALSVRVPQPS
ncbi:MAG TPA: STAS domain-containing protein [Armatimonadota bacterium]|jgi:anti-sigma B factor antagonist